MKRSLSMLLALLTALSCLLTAGFTFTLSAEETEDYELPEQVVTVLEDYTYRLDESITVRKVSYVSAQGQNQTVAILRMPLGDYGLYVGTPGNDIDNNGKSSKTGSGGEKIDGMATDAALDGVDVIAGVNGDFYKTGSDGGSQYAEYALLGTLKKNGVEISDGQMEAGATYLGVTYAGELVLGDVQKSWLSTKDSLYNAFGGEMWLVKNGVNNFNNLTWRTSSSTLIARYGSSKTDLTENPRTCIGYNENEVFLVVFEGRGQDGAVGVDLREMCAFMKDLGCTQAMNLDGGGSSALVAVDANDRTDFDLLAGSMRNVGEAILVTKKQTRDFLRELYYRSLDAFDPADPAYTEDSFTLFAPAMEAAADALDGTDAEVETAYETLLTALRRITTTADASFTLTAGTTDTGMHFLHKLYLVGEGSVELSADGESWTALTPDFVGESGSFFYPARSAKYLRLTGEGTLYGFGEQIDFTALRALLAYADTLNIALYTTATAAPYTAAVEVGTSLLDSEYATQEQVDAAVAALRTAQAGLVMITDKVALGALISQCAAMDLSSYSAKSAAFLTEALKNARTIYNDPDVTQQEADDALALLTMAKNELKAPVNLAYKMDITANCNQGSASKINDGTISTGNYWESKDGSTNVPAANASFVIDLDGLYELDSVTVYPYWGGSRIYKYEVYATADGENWTKIGENLSDAYATDKGFTHEIEGGFTASAVKIQGVSTWVSGRSDINNMHIIEVQVYGDEVGNIALDKPVTSSGSDGSAASSGGGYDRRITDGDRTSYWDAGLYSAHPWAVIDLQGVYRLDEINVIAYWMRTDNRYYRYDVFTSLDGVTYTKVWGKNSTAAETVKGVSFAFPKETYASYVKIIGLYDSANTSFHLNEVRLYGEEVDYPVVLAKQELQAILDRCGDYDLTKYTEEAVALLQEAMTNAAAVLADNTVTVSDVQDSIETLETIENLLATSKKSYTIRDVTLTLAIIGNNGNDPAYDFNHDGLVSISDVTLLLNAIAAG